MSDTTLPVGTTRYYIGGKEVPPPTTPTPLEQVVGLLQQIVGLQREAVFSLTEIRDLLKAQRSGTMTVGEPLTGVYTPQVEPPQVEPPESYVWLNNPRTMASNPDDQRDAPSFSALQGMVAAGDPRSSIDPRYPIFKGMGQSRVLNALIGIAPQPSEE